MYFLVREYSTSNHKPIESTKVLESLTIVINLSNTVATHYLLQRTIITANFGIEVSHYHVHISNRKLVNNLLEPGVKIVLFFSRGIISRSIYLNNVDVKSLFGSE